MRLILDAYGVMGFF